MTLAGLLAHQGGWDEVLMVLVPVAVLGGLLLLADKRARVAAARRDAASSAVAGPTTHPDGSDPVDVGTEPGEPTR